MLKQGLIKHICVRKDKTQDDFTDLFESFRDGILTLDPVFMCEKYLRIDGAPFRLNGTGYKPFADIYRYIALKALEPESKPVVLVKGRQVGATTMAAALEAYFCSSGLFGNNSRPPMRIVHLFPTLGLAAAYTKDKLDPMILGSVSVPGAFKPNGTLRSFVESKLDLSNPAHNSMGFKKFINGNQIWVDASGIDGDRIRGRTVDAAFFDECQDFTDLAIGTVKKVLARARWGATGQGLQVYFGTPKKKGGSYWKMWEKSSQNYYHLRCEKCMEYFPLYRPDINWEDVWLYGMIVRCTHCQHEQDKNEASERGKWIPLNNPDECDYIGYHINQLFIPTFTKEVIEKEKPERSATNTERVYMNEVLGEFYDGEGGTISLEEIHNKCADRDRRVSKGISPEQNIKVYAGFDWGQRAALDQASGRRQGRSYSCAVILTADGPNIFNVEFATRVAKNDPQSKIDIVEEMFRRYSVSLSIGDIGDAFDLTHKLQHIYGDSFLASRASHRVNGHIKFSDDEFPKVIMFEKDYYISELIGLLKEGKIKFPYKSYDKIDWLVKHCTSMDIKITRDKSCEPIRKYVKGDGPNDGLMALLNAYLAWKFDVTQGFKIRQPQNMKYETAKTGKPVHAVLGYVPQMYGGR